MNTTLASRLLCLCLLPSALGLETLRADCVTAPPQIVSWWRAENNASDSVAANNGTLQNGVTFTTGKAGQAFSLDGINDFVEIPHHASLNTPTGVTVEAWVTRTGSNEWNIVASKYDSSINQASWALLVNSNGTLRFTVFESASAGRYQYADSPPGVVRPGVATHVAGTFDVALLGLSQVKLYVNGVAVISPAGPGSTSLGEIFQSTTPVLLGTIRGQSGALADFFSGTIDEVALYRRALSAAEIQAIFAAGSAGKCPPLCVPVPSGAVAWWRAENSALDQVGTNHGILQNGATFATGKVGLAFNLDGINDFVTVPHNTNLNPAGPFSVDAWIKANPVQLSPDQQFLIVDKSHGWTDGTGWALQGNPSGTVAFFFGKGGGGDPASFVGVSTLVSVLDDQWHYLAGVFTGSRFEIYLDGALNNTSAFSGIPVNNTRDASIGRSWGGGTPTRYFRGLIDEVSFYHRALTTNEIAAIFNAGSAGKCGAPSLAIFRSTTNTVVVLWPSPSTGFGLQQTVNGVSSVNWSDVATTPADNGTDKFIIINPPTGNRFYRLFKP